MFAFLPGIPGIDDLRALGRQVDTARHHGVPDGCVLELDLMAAPPESAGFDPLAMIASGGRPSAASARGRRRHPPRRRGLTRVAGLIARVQIAAAAAGAGAGTARRPSSAFSDVKPSLAWAETYPGTLSYYLASAFREVWMQPSGTVGLVGFATNALFLRDALDKAGIEAQFISRGEYKSAANLFTQDSYTDSHREADSRLIESLHTQVWQAVAASRAPRRRGGRRARRQGTAVARRRRHRPAWSTASGSATRPMPASANSLAHRAFHLKPATRTPRTRRRGCICRATRRPPRPEPAPPMPSFPAARVSRRSRSSPWHGPIVSGRGGPQVSAVRRLERRRATPSPPRCARPRPTIRVAAIVLRVDSPGGSVTGSETIWREVNRLRDGGKPVVASMGAVAASGGYYVSMAADAIVANAGTITGSIGVMTGKLVARELKDRLGVGSDSVRTNANADAWSINPPFTEEQHAQVEAEADLFYTDFVERVADGRNLTVEAVDAVARGRVWTGADALERGLVDELGGLRTAIGRAKPLAGIEPDDDVRLVSYPGSSLMDLLRPKPSSQPAAASLPDALRGAGGPLGGRGAQPGRALPDGRQRAVVGRIPLLTGAQWPGAPPLTD